MIACSMNIIVVFSSRPLCKIYEELNGINEKNIHLNVYFFIYLNNLCSKLIFNFLWKYKVEKYVKINETCYYQ